MSGPFFPQALDLTRYAGDAEAMARDDFNFIGGEPQLARDAEHA